MRERLEERNLPEAEAIRYPLSIRECLMGEKNFYQKVGYVVFPIVMQNTLSNVVSLLDNVMVGQVGTLPMSAVAIVNQLIFVFYLCIFGAIAGAGIYTTQYFGKGDYEGVRMTMRYKLVIGGVLCLGAIALFLMAGTFFINLYIAGDTSPADREATLSFAKQYLLVMLIGLPPFTLTQCYAGTLREGGQPVLPMVAGMISMAVNFVFNLLLIFGYLGFPKLGVVGAAVATVISRFVEFAIVVIFAHGKKKELFSGLYRHFRIPRELFPRLLSKSLPLMLNEALWSLGQAALLQSYSVRGIEVVAALNICYTISMLFNEAFISLGSATAILVGEELGANRLVNARRTAWRMAALSIFVCILMGTVLFLISPVVPGIYNTEEEIRLLASACIRVMAVCMPINAYANVAYFTLRAGGRTLITFVFDSCFTWLISVPAAFVLAHYSTLPVIMVFAIVVLLDFFKDLLGFVFMKRGTWVKNMVAD
ncbi:MAG: MATE family efflux transporter [Lachnospiraceae bacterium]|nr:MATE family efflux transporter [Lachnospiraceae bacterium]